MADFALKIEPPPETLKGYWCPACGRFEKVNYGHHVRSGSLSDRCERTEMVALQYTLGPTAVRVRPEDPEGAAA